MNDYIRKAERDLAAATADIGVAESQALRAQVKTTQEILALSIGSYKDGQSSLLDVLDAQRSAATSQANLAQAVQQMAKDYVTLNVAIGSGYNFGGPRSGPNSYEH
ncbi:TolC family protein [Rhizobium laguerreae]|uniref:TolC family protein n=1 Tax=Rhizobium laguerreae TaxID=1076926 RepID=UPI0035E44E61